MSYYAPTTEEAAARRAALAEFDEWNERCLLAAFALFGAPGHYLDIGSGSGAMVRTARMQVVKAIGVDVIESGESGDVRHDLTQPLHLNYQADLITCIEVAEHIESAYERTLVASIARHLAPGGLLIFTVAQPGQPGDHHVNAVGGKHFEHLFYDEGVKVNLAATLALSLFWRYCGGPLSHHLPANLTVYNGREV